MQIGDKVQVVNSSVGLNDIGTIVDIRDRQVQVDFGDYIALLDMSEIKKVVDIDL